MLIGIIDMGATHSFVSLGLYDRLGLKLYYMVRSMIVDTPNLGPVTTLWVSLNCSLTSYGKSFGIDLVCILLNKLDVILGMHWLKFNHVHINYFDKSMSFQEFDVSD